MPIKKETATTQYSCPLCPNTQGLRALAGIDEKIYRLCPACFLIHAGKENFLAPDEEKTRYLQHNNSIEEAGYVNFLYRAINPMLPYLQPGMAGLDYGCGPNPVLAGLLHREGFSCDYYDPLFFPKLDLQQQYDFIFATECFEHFYDPHTEIKKLTKVLKPGGMLAIMTELWQDEAQFATWYYVRDVTHVVFYHKNTLSYIEQHFGFKKVYSDQNRVFVLRKL